MKNIYEIQSGWRVIIHRRELTYRASVPFGGDRTAALAKAQALRDEFYRVHGQFGASGQRPRSNTGISGISEVTKWFNSRPYPCFQVTVGKSQNHLPVRFFFNGLADRTRALRAAIAHRARLAGEDPAQLLRQAEEVACV